MSNALFFAFAVLVVNCCCAQRIDCTEFDQHLEIQKETICSSLVQSPTDWCGDSFINISSERDFPMQSKYFVTLLETILSNGQCLNTSVGTAVVKWLNGPMANVSLSGSFLWTYHWQLGYFAMPRPHNDRIESPYTLGMKCWAYAFLSRTWQPQALLEVTSNAGLDVTTFVNEYNSTVAPTMLACSEVIANCFVNASYSPLRNGTCPLSVDLFHLGYEFQSVRCGGNVPYPFFP